MQRFRDYGSPLAGEGMRFIGPADDGEYMLVADHERLMKEQEESLNPAPEIDWSLVPAGTLIECCDVNIWVARVITGYDPTSEHPFRVRKTIGYRHGRPAPMPWIVYTGGGCPVHSQQQVDYVRKDGTIFYSAEACGFTWDRCVAWRISPRRQ